MSDQYVNQERRDVSGFSRLLFKGVGKIELEQGDHEELTIEANQEVLSRIHTDVKDGLLTIHYESDWKDWTGVRFLGGDKIVFRLMMREIKSLAISGVGNIDAARIASDQLELALSGPGVMTIGTLNVGTLKLDLSGVGSMDLAGTAANLEVALSGAGTVKASRLEADKITVRLSGVGTATVWAKTVLDASISGAGVIEYYGKPQIIEKSSGLGVLKYLGSR